MPFVIVASVKKQVIKEERFLSALTHLRTNERMNAQRQGCDVATLKAEFRGQRHQGLTKLLRTAWT
jgi:hypothetical protein